MSAGSTIFCYDANGNMTQKIAGSTTNYTYDAENHMTVVSGAATATFVYDGDGNRVKGVVGGVTTTYIGNYFEWSGSTGTMKKYYYAGGTRVAERGSSSSLYWLLTDHLGSTSITATNSGSKTAEVRYKAWGETRYTYGTTQTTFRYTGQREESSLGLYWYNSRWYSPGLSRFVSPDTIIPQPGNPQAWDRYSYTYNNPVRFTDLSGHMACDGIDANGNCIKNGNNKRPGRQVLVNFKNHTGSSSAFSETRQTIISAAYQVGAKLASTLNQMQKEMIHLGDIDEGDYHHYSAEEAFLLINGGPIAFTLMLDLESYAGEANYQGGINIYKPGWVAKHPRLILHELSHRLENVLGIKGKVTLPANLRRSNNNYGDDETGFNGFAGGKYDWQFTLPNQLAFDYETIADMGVGWVTGKWGPSSLGDERRKFMDSLLVDYLQPFLVK